MFKTLSAEELVASPMVSPHVSVVRTIFLLSRDTLDIALPRYPANLKAGHWCWISGTGIHDSGYRYPVR
jgi:hypothetical protein